MHGPINVKSPNNISKWQMGFNSAFKGLTSLMIIRMKVGYISAADTNILNRNVKDRAQNGSNDLSLSPIYVANAEEAITLDLYVKF
jgi:hypothetical protein